MMASAAGVKFPIETDRLRIEPFVDDDAADADRLFRHRELWKFNPPRPRGRRARRRRFALYMTTQRQRGLSLWAVREKASGNLVGDCGLMPSRWKGPRTEVAFRIAPEMWGDGYATEAVAAVLEAGLREAGLDEIFARVRADNLASVRVMEKAGMERERETTEGGKPWALYAIRSPS
jgi:ribosomal-protein-alanine N-acetyltransferase